MGECTDSVNEPPRFAGVRRSPERGCRTQETMQLKQLLTDEDAVSPVIGVILMVAITVILAAVIGTFVLGLGDRVGNDAPSASFGFEQNADKVDVTHEGGDVIQQNLTVKYTSNSTSESYTWSEPDGSIAVGDTSTTVKTVDPGTTVRLVWVSPDGSQEQVLQEYQKP